jgi:large subunit ribosomal protein L29
MKANELREMSDEQLQLTLKDTCEGFYRLRIQAQTERLDAPSELRRHRRLIARVKTVQHEKVRAAQAASAAKSAAATS